MTWFYCDHCCDTVKKPKVAAHARRCYNATFTCIDCSQTFDLTTIQAHTVCVTEKEKYVDGVTKSRGTQGSEAGTVPDPHGADILGRQHLTTSWPWKCKLCKVTCTSESTMLAHAAGQKHRRKSRAYASANGNCHENTTLLHKAGEDADNLAMPREELSMKTCATDGPSHTEPENCRMKSGNQKERNQDRSGSLEMVTPATFCRDDVIGVEQYTATEQGHDLNDVAMVEPAAVAPVVQKLIRKHGGTMQLQRLIGAISKKKKRRCGLTGDASMNQVLEAILANTGSGYDVLVVQRQSE